MIGIPCIRAGLAALLLSLASGVPLAAQTLPGTVVTSWVGNTFGNGPAGEQAQKDIDGLYVASDGTCYANTWAEDLSRQWGVYKNGDAVAYLPGGAFYRYGGAAVAGDASYVYLAEAQDGQSGHPDQVAAHTIPPAGTSWYVVRRVSKATLASAPFAGGYGYDKDMLLIGSKTTGIRSPGNVWGLACDPVAGCLYASDTLNGQIDLIATSTMTISGAWSLPAGCQPYGLCWDPLHDLLWVIVQDTATAARQIWAYNAAGVRQTALTITSVGKPVSLAYYNNHLYVADNGPDQNIKTFQSIGTAPAPWTYYGAVGGALGGSGSGIGTVGDWRFYGLTAIGIDGSGNLYVACDGYGPDLNEDGTYRDQRYCGMLESYNLGTRALNWRVESYEFVDTVCIDPGDETSAFGNTAHYLLDWGSSIPGSEWDIAGYTLNWKKYPADFRLGASNTNYPLDQVVRIGGKPFLALGDNYHLAFYRFNAATDGQGAIPCAQFTVATTDPGHVGLAIWTDANGNGVVDAGETAYAGAYINPTVASNIDTNGTLWTSNGANLLKFPCTLSAGGVPQYSVSTLVNIPFSTLPGDTFIQVNRIVYDAASDRMYLMGFTSGYPQPAANSGAGTVVQCYANWSTSPTVVWEKVLPITATGVTSTSLCVEAMAGAGSYLFLQYLQEYKAIVLSKTDGTTVGTLAPDPAVVGDMSDIWTDQTHGISAFKRANGEYVITVEDDAYTKGVMYRWIP